MSAGTEDLVGRDYDTTGLANFEDGPSSDVADDLAALLARRSPAVESPAPPHPDMPGATDTTAKTGSAKAGAARSKAAQTGSGTRPAAGERSSSTPRVRRRGETRSAGPTATSAPSARKPSGTVDTAARDAGAQDAPNHKTHRPAASATRSRRTSGPDGDPGEHVSRILYLPVELVEALRIYRATTIGVSNTQIALGALNAHYLNVDVLVDAQAGARVSTGPLFDEIVNERQIPKRQVEITPTRAQLRIIDDVVESSSAKDRSQLFAVVIRRWLADHT